MNDGSGNNGWNGMPFPFVFMHPEQHSRRPTTAHTEVPARVRVAMDFLQHLTAKTEQRIAVNDIQMESFEGQKLTAREETTRNDALTFLSDYLLGTGTMDKWEVASIRSTLGMHPAECYGYPPNQRGRRWTCGLCDSKQPNPQCPLCHGLGSFLAFPDVHKQGELEGEEQDEHGVDELPENG
jgi:hypothetical protein